MAKVEGELIYIKVYRRGAHPSGCGRRRLEKGGDSQGR